MLAEIETKILQRLADAGLPVDTSGTATPAVYCRIESGRFIRAGQEKLRLEGTVSLDFVFTSSIPSSFHQQWDSLPLDFTIDRSSTEDTRRNVVFPILTAALNLLLLQDLGLEIDPLVPLSVENITGANDQAAGLLVYRMQFRTCFYVKKIDDETVTDLVKVALDYYLQEPVDDGVKDGADEITFET